MRLAYYREGLNAHEASLVTFEILSFYKVFEVRKRSAKGERNPTKVWIDANFEAACKHLEARELQEFNAERGNKGAGDCVVDSYRVAAAHTSEQRPSDSDSSLEIRRLYAGSRVTRALAKHYITETFGFSRLPF